MQLGIHVGTFQRSTLEATLDAVADHGFPSVHFHFAAAGIPSMPERIDKALCERIAAELAERQIEVATLSGTFNMIHPDRDVRREGLRRLGVVAASAGGLGAPVVTLCTGTRHPDSMWRNHADNAAPAAWDDLLESMASALEIAERYQVTLGVEPEVCNVVDSAAKARRLLDCMQSERLGIIMDAANLFHRGDLARMGELLDEAFALLGPDIVVAHAKDLDRDGDAGRLAAGQGVLDYGHYLRLLQVAGFDGPLILHGLKEDEVAESCAFLRAELARLG